MDTITEIIKCKIWWIILYAAFTTFALIIIIITHKSKRKKFVDWKKDSLNLYVYKREWERNDDELVNELFSENERLTKENKLLSEKYTKLSILAFIVLIGTFLMLKIKGENKTSH